MNRLRLTSLPGVQVLLEPAEVFAGRGLQDWTSLSALSLTAHAVMVRNIYFMCSDRTSWAKVGFLPNHKAVTGGVSGHELLMLIPQQYQYTFINCPCWTLSQKVLWEPHT